MNDPNWPVRVSTQATSWAFSAEVPCQCGARISLSVETTVPKAGHVGVVLTGVPCNDCDRTHTVEIKRT